MSKSKENTHHDVFTQNTKIDLKKHKKNIAISYASYLLTDVIVCHQKGYGYIHICTQYLIEWMRQTLNLTSKRWWRLGRNYNINVITLARHISSHSVHQYEKEKKKKKLSTNK